MDDLDRLYYEFVEILRSERGSGLVQPLTVQELYERLIPYRRVRNQVGFPSNDHYEIAFSRLLSGERGYLQGDPAMQEELRAGLEEALPDLRRHRAFAAAEVRLNPREIPPPGHTRYAPPEVRERNDWRGDALEAAAPDAGPLAESQAPQTAAGQGSEPPSSEPEAAPVEEPTELTPASEAELEFCPSCGGDLPARAAFCPYCGFRLLPETCDSCGAELQPDWRFCADCGMPRDSRPADSA